MEHDFRVFPIKASKKLVIAKRADDIKKKFITSNSPKKALIIFCRPGKFIEKFARIHFLSTSHKTDLFLF
jgi:hypothetical protein